MRVSRHSQLIFSLLDLVPRMLALVRIIPVVRHEILRVYLYVHFTPVRILFRSILRCGQHRRLFEACQHYFRFLYSSSFVRRVQIYLHDVLSRHVSRIRYTYLYVYLRFGKIRFLIQYRTLDLFLVQQFPFKRCIRQSVTQRIYHAVRIPLVRIGDVICRIVSVGIISSRRYFGISRFPITVSHVYSFLVFHEIIRSVLSVFQITVAVIHIIVSEIVIRRIFREIPRVRVYRMSRRIYLSIQYPAESIDARLTHTAYPYDTVNRRIIFKLAELHRRCAVYDYRNIGKACAGHFFDKRTFIIIQLQIVIVCIGSVNRHSVFSVTRFHGTGQIIAFSADA